MKYAIRKIVIGMTLFCLASGINAANQEIDAKEMATRATNSLIAARSLDIPKYKEITELILQENFIELERLSNKYEEGFLKDPIYESPLVKLYDAIDGSNSELLGKLDKWVASKPSYISYGVRGMYKKTRGYHFRGTESIDRTSSENLANMTKNHEEAKKDLLEALKKNSKFVPAYIGLIEIQKAYGGIDETQQTLATAVQEIPQTYYIRHTYLQSLEPRWGGSYEKMQSYTDSLDKAALINPRIWSLKAEVSAELGFNALLKEDYQNAITYYTTALKYGDRLEFLKNRGISYMMLKQNDLALADFVQYKKYDADNKEVNDNITRLSSIQSGTQHLD